MASSGEKYTNWIMRVVKGLKRNTPTLIKKASGINEKYFPVTHPLIVGSTISITLYPVTKDSLDLRKGIEGMIG